MSRKGFSMANVDRRTRLRRSVGLIVAAVVLASACGSGDASTTTERAADTGNSWVIPNHGGDLEGHTPRGFEGSGVGLFTGDELNANFPQDDGVQIWLTFTLPPDLGEVTGATLRSDALTVRGNPFETLGSLQAAPVRFDAFGPPIVGVAEPVGPSVTCPDPTGSSFSCDVTEAALAELADGRDRLQIQLRFEGVSDPDGEQDMALFFLTDSNTNEPGIFQLELAR